MKFLNARLLISLTGADLSLASLDLLRFISLSLNFLITYAISLGLPLGV